MTGNLHGMKIFYLLISMLGIIATLSGPVDVDAAEIRSDEIKSIIVNYIEKNMPWSSDEKRIIFLTKVADVAVDGNRLSPMVQERENEDFIGDSSFAIKYYSSDTLAKSATVRVRIEVLTDVVTTVKPLRKGRKIIPGDVQVVKKWVRRMPGQYMKSLDEVVGKTLSVSLGVNREVTRHIVKSPLMVIRGNFVRILFDNDRLRISTVGISEENGVQGELIRVKALSSQKTIFAKVTGDSAVRVIF